MSVCVRVCLCTCVCVCVHVKIRSRELPLAISSSEGSLRSEGARPMCRDCLTDISATLREIVKHKYSMRLYIQLFFLALA